MLGPLGVIGGGVEAILGFHLSRGEPWLTPALSSVLKFQIQVRCACLAVACVCSAEIHTLSIVTSAFVEVHLLRESARFSALIVVEFGVLDSFRSSFVFLTSGLWRLISQTLSLVLPTLRPSSWNVVIPQSNLAR